MEGKHSRPIVILMAEDDPDDRMLAQEAFAESRLHNRFLTVEDGVELLDYLNHRGQFADKEQFPLPGIILLDLNMPRMDGRAAIKAIREDPVLKVIPIVVMTTSKMQEDIVRSYELGVNSFITKPLTFSGMVTVLKELGRYWFEIVELPPMGNG